MNNNHFSGIGFELPERFQRGKGIREAGSLPRPPRAGKIAIWHPILLGLLIVFATGCHRDAEPALGPTNPTPPPTNMQGGKLGPAIQGGPSGNTASPGGAAPTK